MALYLSSNWWNPSDAVSLEIADCLNSQRVPMVDWSVFYNMTCEDNASVAVQTIRDCRVFAAVFTDPDHPYSGTLELMAMALALDKPVVVLVATPPNPGVKNNKQHNWSTAFDRYLLYHPSISVHGDSQSFLAHILSLMN